MRLTTRRDLSQAHIFLPLTVALGASRLVGERKRQQLEGHSTYYYGDGGQGGLDGETASGAALVDLEVQCCADALRKSQCFNQLARDQLVLFESREFHLFVGAAGV